MLFNSITFLLIFLPIVYFGFWRLHTKNQRYAWLTVASYVFYGTWNFRFIPLLLFSTAVSYFAGRGIAETSSPWRRKLFLIAPITIDLALLAYFKYSNFFIQTVDQAILAVGREKQIPL